VGSAGNSTCARPAIADAGVRARAYHFSRLAGLFRDAKVRSNPARTDDSTRLWRQWGTVGPPTLPRVPPLQVPDTGPDAVPAELPVLAGMPPCGLGQVGMVNWLGCGGFVGEIGGPGARAVGGDGAVTGGRGAVTDGGEGGTRCCGASATSVRTAIISSTIINQSPASAGKACASNGVIATLFVRLPPPSDPLACRSASQTDPHRYAG
jgi:hypothetical protein